MKIENCKFQIALLAIHALNLQFSFCTFQFSIPSPDTNLVTSLSGPVATAPGSDTNTLTREPSGAIV